MRTNIIIGSFKELKINQIIEDITDNDAFYVNAKGRVLRESNVEEWFKDALASGMNPINAKKWKDIPEPFYYEVQILD